MYNIFFMDGLLTLIKHNICTIVMIVMVSAASNSLQIVHWSIPLDLEMGAVLAMAILFGWRVFPGVLVALYLTTLFFLGDDNPHIELLFIIAILKSITPYMTLNILKLMPLDNFFVDSRISLQHLAVVILLAMLLNVILMYFVTLGQEFSVSDGFDLTIHLSRNISGGILGSVIFFGLFIAVHEACFKTKKNEINQARNR